ncbi:hypothetical protein [Streptomyces zaomyceticus]|uniref:hypothetical protein n=1 Tax=Streptomyces zaomyceticus TaxID=68286 RepID=UPI002E24558F
MSGRLFQVTVTVTDGHITTATPPRTPPADRAPRRFHSFGGAVGDVALGVRMRA